MKNKAWTIEHDLRIYSVGLTINKSNLIRFPDDLVNVVHAANLWAKQSETRSWAITCECQVFHGKFRDGDRSIKCISNTPASALAWALHGILK